MPFSISSSATIRMPTRKSGPTDARTASITCQVKRRRLSSEPPNHRRAGWSAATRNRPSDGRRIDSTPAEAAAAACAVQRSHSRRRCARCPTPPSPSERRGAPARARARAPARAASRPCSSRCGGPDA